MSRNQVTKVLAALNEGRTLYNIYGYSTQNGMPIYVRGQGICSPTILKGFIAANPTLGARIRKIADDNRKAAMLRANESRRIVAAPAILRDDGRFTYAVICAATAPLPDFLRNDVRSAMFLAVAEGHLKPGDASKRVRDFVAAHNRQFSAFVPVIGGRLQSLDQQVYDDGPTRLVDTVTRGLWQ